jgi:hypothetical protein
MQETLFYLVSWKKFLLALIFGSLNTTQTGLQKVGRYISSPKPAANRAPDDHPKLIAAQGHSGRVSSSLQDAIQHLDQAPETALTR